MSQKKGNGKLRDEGLMVLKEAFAGAKYLEPDGKVAAELIMLGSHRERQIPDNLIMEVYGTVTEGKNASLTFRATSGRGYVANIESYADLILFIKGELECLTIHTPMDVT